MSTALYRRYRPDTFADVIGQEHVTEPLMAALKKNRVNHAYLFSGPRGCGKTTSARILARCLNCAKGPTPTPCGTCDSCVELARGGSGSLDVIEIDAASHGGVDDARDLRERATFAPVRDRYKIFIIDEAHMVTSAGFNALLKIVEEPPEHIKFIFATTEPDKVIGTIRSRTHHYPFRLVPPEPLMAYLEQLCASENVPVAPGVLSLVVRAGGGSVRDSLSVLDQLMAGAGPNGLDYELAVSLLGYTHASLLDDVVDAVAASDAGTVFRAVDRVIQTGHDPRRFVEDLLERFRDLIIINAMPESAQAILRGVPEDQITRMRTQATQLRAAELSRAADVTNTALTEMTGATSPRLHLELLCARILLPGADQTERGMAARLDRIERRLAYGGVTAPAPSAPAESDKTPNAAESRQTPVLSESPAAQPAPAEVRASGPVDEPALEEEREPALEEEPEQVAASVDWGGGWGAPAETAASAAAPSAGPAPSRQATPSSASAERSVSETQPATQERPRPQQAQQPAPRIARSPQAAHQPAPAPEPERSQPEPQQARPAQPAQPAQQSAPSAPRPSSEGIEVLRRSWPDVVAALTSIKRSTWALVSQNGTVKSFDGSTVELGFTTNGLAETFGRGDHADNVRRAIHNVLGLDCRVRAVLDGGPAVGESGPKASSRAIPAADVDWGLVPAAPPAAPPVAPPADRAGQGTNQPISSTAQPNQGRNQTDQPAVAPRQSGPSPIRQQAPAPASALAPASAQGHASVRQTSAMPAYVSSPERPFDDEPPYPEEPPQDDEPPFPDEPPADWGAPASEPPPREDEDARDIPTSDLGESEAPPATMQSAAQQGRLSMYQRLSQSPEARAGRSLAPRRAVETAYVEDVPSADDETIEESGLFGRAAVERILGGRLIEERSLDGNQQ